MGAPPPIFKRSNRSRKGHRNPISFLERFRAKWIPVRVKKTRQIKNLEPRFDSIETRLQEIRDKEQTTMHGMFATVVALLGAGAASSAAEAQTLRMMKSLDAPHYDGQRTTWSPTSDIVNMFQDTLVAMDWDGRTPVPYLATSWTVSPDGKTYTFKLRDDVTFCSGKKFTAEDVVYSCKRLKDPAIKGPFAWRAGNIKELRAPDPYTVEYELEEP